MFLFLVFLAVKLELFPKNPRLSPPSDASSSDDSEPPSAKSRLFMEGLSDTESTLRGGEEHVSTKVCEILREFQVQFVLEIYRY